MTEAAEILRWLLITLQATMCAWMIVSGLWRRMPIWTAWIACEALSRLVFDPHGNYWHHIWRPLQPSLLLLLALAACEARYQVGMGDRFVTVLALAIAPVGLSLPLPSLITLRVAVCAGVALLLLSSRGRGLPLWHARTLGAVAAIAAATGWIPAYGRQWWMMRLTFLGCYCGAMVAWGWMFTRRSLAR